MFTFKTVVVILSLLAAQCNANRFNRTRVSKSIMSKTATALTASQTAAILNATVADCFLTLPANPLTSAGLSTPFLLQAPCSMAVGTQQAFAEAAIYDPATGAISIYHPLVLDANKVATIAPVVPVIPVGAVVALWFGFNGGNLQLLDANKQDANNSPTLKTANCINGLPGAQGDIFGQVSWCNAEQWFTAANAGIASGKTVIPDLGVDSLGNACPTSRSFEITDACPSDNVPTQYLLLANGQTIQDTAANRAANPGATVINNASDEALLTNVLDPLIGCKPFVAPSLTDPGAKVPALALSELQASAKQAAPVGLVPLNNPDCLLTADGSLSVAKTNVYRLGVGQPIVAAGAADGTLVPYCQNMVSVAPPFLKGFQTILSAQASPDTGVGSNLFTFLANRYLTSLTQLTCPPTAIPFQPVVCTLDGAGAAQNCVITLKNTTTGTATSVKAASASTVASAKPVSVSTIASVKAASASSIASIKTSSSSPIASVKTSAASISAIKTTTAAIPVTSAKAVTTNPATLAIATKSPTLSLTSTKATKKVVIEVITFFVFFLSLGSPAPGVLPNINGNGFVVLEEVFVDIPSAANKACTHQFNACAAFAGSAFAGTDCLNQMNQCQGVASTASATASTPGTLTQTATVPTSVTVTGSGTAVSIVGIVQTAGAAASSISGIAAAAACPVKRDITVSECIATATEFVTITSIIATPTPMLELAKKHAHGHGFLEQAFEHN
jgi:hypothetical protein